MLNKIYDALDLHKQILNIRAQRRQILASNIANADTPGYKARDFDFASELSRFVKISKSSSAQAGTMATTSDRHIATTKTGGNAPPGLFYRTPLQQSMDGNTVEMESERIRFADNAVRSQASLTFLNGYIRSMKSAMQRE